MSTTTPDLAKLHAEINQHPYVKLLRSKDPMMWYSSRVGEMIRVIGVNLDGYWAREGDKYNAINVIRFSDCEWVPHPLSRVAPPAPDVPQGDLIKRVAAININFEKWATDSKQGYCLTREDRGLMATYFSDPTEHAWRGYCAAALAAPSQEPAVPQGWKAVPVEPTQEMMEAMPSMPAIGAPGDMDLKNKGWSLKAIQNRHRWITALAATPAALREKEALGNAQEIALDTATEHALVADELRDRLAAAEAERDQLRAQVERLQGGEPVTLTDEEIEELQWRVPAARNSTADDLQIRTTRQMTLFARAIEAALREKERAK